MTHTKLAEEIVKEIEEINLEHGTHTGLSVEDCCEDNCIDRDNINKLKAKLSGIKESCEASLKFLEENVSYSDNEIEPCESCSQNWNVIQEQITELKNTIKICEGVLK